jgi:hypothetical protein
VDVLGANSSSNVAAKTLDCTLARTSTRSVLHRQLPLRPHSCQPFKIGQVLGTLILA